MSALACALAQETAATGHRVLWCCLRGESELAALGMLTKGAGIDLRRVMVTRDLGANDWRALEAAAARLARIPLHFVDAHGADLAELRRLATALTTRQREPAHRLELVVLDGLEAPDAPALRGLEQIAEDLEVPILAVFSRPRGWCGAGLPLRRGTLALRLDEAREGGQETSYRARWPALRLVVSGSAGARS